MPGGSITEVEGERNAYDVVVALDDEDLIEQIGTGWLAKALYKEAGSECIEDLDAGDGYEPPE